MIIRNKKTGETREIAPEQASKFGVAPASPSAQMNTQDQPDQRSFTERLVTGKAIPLTTAGITGLLGSLTGAVGGGFGAIPLGAASAGGGYVAGQGIQKVLSKLLGYEDPVGDITSNPEALQYAGTDALLRGGGKVLSGASGILKNPVSALDSYLSKILKNSPAEVNMGDIGKRLLESVDELATNNPIQGSSLREGAKQTARNITTQPTLGEPMVPISTANEIRKNVGRMGFGGDRGGQIDKQIAQVLNRLLREEVTGATPLAEPILTGEKTLLGTNQFMQDLPWWLGGGVSRLGTKLAGGGFSGMEKFADNPLLRTLLLSLSGGSSQQ